MGNAESGIDHDGDFDAAADYTASNHQFQSNKNFFLQQHQAMATISEEHGSAGAGDSPTGAAGGMMKGKTATTPHYTDENNGRHGNGGGGALSTKQKHHPSTMKIPSSGMTKQEYQRQLQKLRQEQEQIDHHQNDDGGASSQSESGGSGSATSANFSHDKYDGFTQRSDDTSTVFQGLEEIVSRDDGMSLMGASAAVFDLLAQDQEEEEEEQQQKPSKGGRYKSVAAKSPKHQSREPTVQERSAAVFQYLEDESRKGNKEAVVSFLETATVVSAYLQQRTTNGSTTASATAGGAATTSPRSYAGTDVNSVSDMSAAVFHLLDDLKTTARGGNPPDDDNKSVYTISDHSVSKVFELLEDAQSVAGGGGGDDATMSVSGHSAAVFHLLEDAQSVDPKSVSEFSAAVFQMLDTVHRSTNDDEQTMEGEDGGLSVITEASAAIFKLLDAQSTVGGSPKASRNRRDPPKTSNNRKLYPITTSGAMDNPINLVSPTSDGTSTIPPIIRPKLPSNASTSGGISSTYPPSMTQEQSATTASSGDVSRPLPPSLQPAEDPPADLDTKSIGSSVRLGADDATEVQSIDRYYEAAQTQQEDYPEITVKTREVVDRFYKDQTPAQQLAGRRGRTPFQVASYLQVSAGNAKISSSPRHAVGDDDASTLTPTKSRRYDRKEEEVDDEATDMLEIDLEFVENFDSTFNEFVGQHPRFLMKNPDLVHNLRVTKLQKLLEFNVHVENDMRDELELLQAEKAAMEQVFQHQLRDASRKKAAREINLQGDLNKLHLSSKQMGAKMMWQFVTLSETKAKKQHQLRQKYRNAAVNDGSRAELVKHIPNGPDGDELVSAIMTPSSSYGRVGPNAAHPALTEEQANELRQFQVDNAFLNAEVTVLKKKLMYQKMEAKKHAWVESVLLRLDEKAMQKLKSRFQKKSGVEF